MTISFDIGWDYCLDLRLVEKFCNARCMIGMVPDVNNMPNTEQFCRKVANEWEARLIDFWLFDFFMGCKYIYKLIASCFVFGRSRWKIFTFLLSLTSPNLGHSTSKM